MAQNSFNRTDLVSFTALLMSMLAVFVSIYEAKILKEQQMIMLSQERTSVWPYIDGLMSYKYADKVQITYTVENKGIGPSKVRTMEFRFNGQQIDDYLVLLDSLNTYFPDTVDLGVSFGSVQGDVLSPGETVQTLKIESKRFPNDYRIARQLPMQYDICYCSVYDECWSFKSYAKQEREVCD